jgi:hypothetical protein
VTLNITSLAHTRIYQSGDFRLTDPRTGKELDRWEQKQIVVSRAHWTALLAYCGEAHTGSEYVSEWMLAMRRPTPIHAVEIVHTVA